LAGLPDRWVSGRTAREGKQTLPSLLVFHQTPVWYHDFMSDDDEGLQQLPVRFPRSVHEALRRAAFEAHRSMNALVVEAVREKLGLGRDESATASESDGAKEAGAGNE
jgi:hypothetical protein